jgi:hypothetical protein
VSHPTRIGNALNCKDAYAILQRMARQANAHLPPQGKEIKDNAR